MLQATKVAALREAIAQARSAGKKIGLVPTMGALHDGHVSLIRRARERCGFVVVTIFVNPAQFGPAEDFTRYPRTLETDLALCRTEGVDLVFHPETDEVYPDGFQTHVEVRELQKGMEGDARPGHFQGVATVVLKLFNMVQADLAFFGQKDAQQVRIIQQLVRDMNVPTEIMLCPTVREANGLALSSRNRFLNPEERRQAAVLFQALQESENQILAGETRARVIQDGIAARIKTAPLARLDYVALVSWDTLKPLEELAGRVLIAVAARFGSTRLIDNIVITPPVLLA
jgi:pantoate--beta-alanine ligase